MQATAAPLYSPFPPLEYSRLCPQVGRVGVGVELSAPEDRAAWNLYYLSDPGVDSFVNEWDAGPGPDLEMLSACSRALGQSLSGRFVSTWLAELPSREFAMLLSGASCHHLAPYVLRGNAWVETVKSRAALFRGLVRAEGSVKYAQFAGRPITKVTRPSDSAIIMPLSLRKT